MKRALGIGAGALAVVVAVSLALAARGGDEAGGDWPLHNHDLASTRAADGAEIDSGNVEDLQVRWRFRLQGGPREAGIFASNPLAVGETVYVQDLMSNVFALDRATGRVRWSRWFRAGNPGPNGLAFDGGRVYGSTDTTAFALDAVTGRTRWLQRTLGRNENFVDIAPVVANGFFYTSSVGYPPGGKGVLYGLDAGTGRIVWRFSTIRGEWRFPNETGGGGAWYPVSVDEEGRVYSGNSNPGPWGGTPERPNGGSFPGPALYTDSLLVLDGESGRLLWYDQVVPHDIRDYDFHVSPILVGDVVYGAGKSGDVIAWDRNTRERIWHVEVGLQVNDEGPLPRTPVRICPGLYGGVLTPMAYADGRLFVPVVNLCTRGSAIGYQDIRTYDATPGTGELVALDGETGRRVWTRRLPSAPFSCATVANDVVFTATYDGTIYAFRTDDGEQLWSAKARAGINACPAVAGDLLLVGAGVKHRDFDEPRYELIAFGLRE